MYKYPTNKACCNQACDNLRPRYFLWMGASDKKRMADLHGQKLRGGV